jgi:hypothetical protein
VTIEIPNSADLDALALARRSGWPEDLRVLVARYPREQWNGHPNLGEMARFWLSRHGMFRELSGAIEQIAVLFRAGKLPPAEVCASVRAAAAIYARPAQRPPSDRRLALFPDLPRG